MNVRPLGRVEIASQTLLFERGVSYRLHSRLESSGIDATLGLHWAFIDSRGNDTVSRSADLSADGNSEWTFAFDQSSSGTGRAPLRLVLLYERPLAGPRGDGWVRIDSLSLEKLP